MNNINWNNFKIRCSSISKIMTNEEQIQEKIATKEVKYTITLTTYDDGTCNLSRVNDGFNIYELFGVVNLIDKELMIQIRGGMPDIKIDSVKRTAIID